VWLLCDKDAMRRQRVTTFLERQGVSIRACGSEKEFPEDGISVAIFTEGWNNATVRSVKERYNVAALLCIPVQIGPERYESLIESGYDDVIEFPPSRETVSAWERTVEEVSVDELIRRRQKTTYTQTQEQRAFEPRPLSERRAKVWAVVAAKGGVGKTTISVLMANELQRGKRRVVVADLDPEGDQVYLHRLSAYVTADRYEILPDAMTDAQLQQNMVENRELGWWLIPKSEKPMGISLDATRRLIHLASQWADFVILDCHPGRLISTIVAMQEADRVWAVCTPDRSTFVGLSAFLSAAGDVLGKTSIVLNKVNHPKRVLEAAKSAAEGRIGVSVSAMIPLDKILYDRSQEGKALWASHNTQNLIAHMIGASGQENTKKRRWF